MDRQFQRIRPIIRYVIRHARTVFIAAILVSLVGFYFARQLHIDSDLSNLIPRRYPSVQALEKLRETVGAESDAAVAIVSPSFDANKEFAETLIPHALALVGKGRSEAYLRRVEYRKETSFLENNALYFATYAELDSVEAFLQDKITESRLEANPFFFDLDDEEETAEDPTSDLIASYERLVGKEYPISDDSTTMVLRFFPTGSQTNIRFIEDLYTDLEALVDSLQPSLFHPEMKVTLVGRMLRQLVEVRTITDDVFQSFGIGVLIVLVLVVLYFFYKSYSARSGGQFSRTLIIKELVRTPFMGLLVGLPLLMSLTWTFGLAYVVYGTLNLMTSTLGLVLFGLGIDYGIHFYARYTEERGRGYSVSDAAEITFVSTGQAITIGALTTASALYILVFADFRGFSEFGLIAGTGVIFALISMTIVMPAILAVFERHRLLNLESGGDSLISPNGRIRYFRAPRILVIGSLLVVTCALVFLPRVEFQYEFGRLEPEYEEYNRRFELVQRVYNDFDWRNPAYIVVDSPDEVVPITRALHQHIAQDTLSPTIRSVESLQERFPISTDDQEAKLSRLDEIRRLIDDPFIQTDDSEELYRLEQAAQTRESVSIDQLPESLKNQFLSKSGEVGNFILIYPSVGLSDGRQSMSFSEDIGTVVTQDGRTYHAGSTSLVGADMLRLMLKEAPWMVLFTLVIVGAFMRLNFGSIKWAMLALLPLVVGILWMLLLMEVFGLKLNFYNLVVLPAVLGIGNDAGVHLVHRYREEGSGSIIHVLLSTGEHVGMGSLTTAMGFGGLMLSFHPGLYSIGILANVGIGTTLLAALVFLPALLQWFENRGLEVFPDEENRVEERSVLQSHKESLSDLGR